MAYKILLNKKAYHLSEADLPCLIHYTEKMGGSQLTMTIIADLFLRGSKILLFTAYPSARDNFYGQTQGMDSKIIFVEKKEDLNHAQNYQAIILKSGDEELFFVALNTLNDIKERVVLIKNVEVFTEKVIKTALAFKKIIISGNIDRCVAKKQISSKFYETIIAFSEPDINVPIDVPKLKNFSGYLCGANKKGLIKLKA